MKTYGFGIIGPGTIGTFHAKQIQQLKRGRLVAVCGTNQQRTAEFAREFHCTPYTDLEEMLRHPELDIVCICTPSGLHAEQAIACANKKKHVVIEKPLEITAQSAWQIIEQCKQQGVKLAVISQHRLHPNIAYVKSLLQANKFGQVAIGNAAILWYRTQDYYDSGKWRGTRKWDGGGALINQGIHTVDLLQYLMGPVQSVFAHCATLGHEIEVEDSAVLALRFASGALGSIVSTTSAYPGLSTRIEILGTEGSAIIENNEVVYCHYHSQTEEEKERFAAKTSFLESADPAAAIGNTHGLQLEDMMEAIEQDREPVINGEEGWKPLEMILAAYESARTGRIVQLPLTPIKSKFH